MKENKIAGIIENSVAARVIPLTSSLLSLQYTSEPVIKSDFLDDDVRGLVGEVYAGR
jgi:hypothetical protein